MGIKFFGQYLLEKNIISVEQLLMAVRYQESQNLRFGEYAETKGYLTKADTARILNEQKRTDTQFGELAVKLGLLSENQVKEILVRQKNDHVMIGAALVQKGFLTEHQLESELALFREDQSQYAAGEVKVPEGIAHPEIMKSFCDITVKMLTRVSNIAAKPGAGVLISRGPERNDVTVRTRLSGDLNYDYVMSTSRGVAVRLASGVIGADASSEPDDIVIDAVKEFCNIVCGNMVAIMAKTGRNVTLGIPEELSDPEGGCGLVKGGDAVSFMIGSTAGDIALLICAAH